VKSPLNHCSICSGRKAGTTEVYLLREGPDTYVFNVDKTKQIVADGRPSTALSEQTITKIVAVNHYASEHLQHVDPLQPGTAAHRYGGLVLLDGIHRAVRCLSEKRAFYVRALSYQESLACVVRQEIASSNPQVIVQRLRRVLESDSHAHVIEAEIECGPEVLEQVRALLTPQERKRLTLRSFPESGGKYSL
jgi:hypothetical protein